MLAMFLLLIFFTCKRSSRWAKTHTHTRTHSENVSLFEKRSEKNGLQTNSACFVFAVWHVCTYPLLLRNFGRKFVQVHVSVHTTVHCVESENLCGLVGEQFGETQGQDEIRRIIDRYAPSAEVNGTGDVWCTPPPSDAPTRPLLLPKIKRHPFKSFEPFPIFGFMLTIFLPFSYWQSAAFSEVRFCCTSEQVVTANTGK